ncbi:MAG TPA: helix-turn-helix transcriptional regulator [Rhizomicrobium sp.]|jgi:DNA-binding CsgD family transcriptional regulator
MHAALPDDLIGHLYDAAVDARLWRGMAGKIATAFDSTSTIVKFHGGDGGVELLEMTENMVVPDQRREWAEDWHRRDLWVHRTVANGMDKIVTAEMLVTPEEQRSSGFYGEWLSYFDIFHVVGAAFSMGEGAIGILGIHRPRDGAAYDAQDRHRTALLLPHLARTVRLGRQLSKANLAQVAALDALDRLDTGVVVLDTLGRIVHANAEAETSLRDNVVMGAANGRFIMRNADFQTRFTRLLREALAVASGRAASEVPGVLVIPRLDALPLSISVTPLRPNWSRLLDPGPLAIVFIKDPERPRLHLDRLRDLFGFTPTEAVIAADLARGKGIEEIAAARRIGVGTVRWHLKRILAKTNTTRQAEMVALLARSVAVLPG